MTALDELSADLLRAGVEVRAAARPVVTKAAVNVKNRMRQEASGHKHAPNLPSAISYDLTDGGLGFECGPERGKAGSLAFYYFGNSKIGASIPDPVIALRDEAENTCGYLSAAVSAVMSA